MFLKNIHYFSILILLALIVSCKKAPSYPVTPSIEIDQPLRVVSGVNIATNAKTDTVFISLKFKDGDGDIGSLENSTVYDFFVEMEKKDLNGYSPVIFPAGVNLNARLPQFSAAAGPIDGTIIHKVQLDYLGDFVVGGLSKGDSVRFNVRIMDRANHYSNWVTTSSIKLWENF